MGSFYRDSIHYVKTDLRIEHMKYFPLELFNVQDKDTLTLFTHEWALVGKRNVFNRVKFEHSLKWLKNHDYKFSFFN